MLESITIPSEIPEAIKWLVTAIVVPFLGYMTSKITKIDDKIVSIETKVDTANMTLLGQDGASGHIARLNRVEGRVESLALAVAANTGQIVKTKSEGKDA